MSLARSTAGIGRVGAEWQVTAEIATSVRRPIVGPSARSTLIFPMAVMGSKVDIGEWEQETLA